MFLSDVHHAAKSSDEDRLIADLKEKRQNRVILGVGDELDCIARSDKRHDPSAVKDKFFTIDKYMQLIDAETDDYISILDKYTKPEEWLGHISGNHPTVVDSNGISPILRICTKLDHRYLGYSAFIPLHLAYEGKTVSCMIMAHHGFGGTNARKEGSAINSYIDHAIRFEGWNIAAYAHRHDRWVMPIMRIGPQHVRRDGRPLWLEGAEKRVVQCGTYMRTLSHTEFPTYAEQRGYTPKSLGCVVLTIGIDRITDGGQDRVQLAFRGSNI